MDQIVFRGRRGATLLSVSLLLCPAIFGCTSGDRLKKQIAGLETEITTLRADQDRMEERMAAVELNAAAPRAPVAPTVDRVEHARLKVIHLQPADESAPADPAASEAPSTAPEAPGHRPIIRGTGDRVIKLGDGDGVDESTRRDAVTEPVATLDKGARGN